MAGVGVEATGPGPAQPGMLVANHVSWLDMIALQSLCETRFVAKADFPSGSSGEHRQQAKFRFLDEFEPHLASLRGTRDFILCGDINIAHKEHDLKNWRGNRKNSGFLPEERTWMTRLFGDTGLVDVYRHLQPGATDDCYTWWSNRGQAYANNVGWRLDYHVATAVLAAAARSAAIYKDVKFSDHAPLTIDYGWSLASQR